MRLTVDPTFAPRRARGRLRSAFRFLVLLSFVACLVLAGCGGGGKPKKKKKKRKKDKTAKKAGAEEKDPTIKLPVSDELKKAVKGLGAKDPTYWEPAVEDLKARGEEAIPGLNWGLRFPLQNIRARCCNILSQMRKSEKMIPGAIDALKKWPDDVTPYEAKIRRWAAKLLSDLPSIYTEEAMLNRVDKDKDVGVRVFLAAGAVKLGKKEFVSHIIKGLAAEDGEVAAWAASAFAELIPHANLDAKGFGAMPQNERAAKSEEVRGWWKANYGKTKPLKVSKNYEPWPVTVPVKAYEEPDEPLDPEDEREVELYVRDAQDHLANGDIRKACACYATAFRYSGRRQKELVLKQHELQRQIGPDFADKSYKYLREKLIPWDPLNEDFWLAAAKSALASGGGVGKGWAKECLQMVLILVPDHDEGKSMMADLGGE
ncbi:MAG: HEAT repeat domain-containing protein [Planctomycetota bacterium]